MAKIQKAIRIDQDANDRLQEIADQEFDGNWTAALEAAMRQAVATRAFCENTRWDMYSAVKRDSPELADARQIKNLCDMLQV